MLTDEFLRSERAYHRTIHWIDSRLEAYRFPKETLLEVEIARFGYQPLILAAPEPDLVAAT